MKTIETLRDEHEGVLEVLRQLERAAGAAERGAPVPPDVFADIQEFFATFVDRCRHGKEETELFPRLVAGGSPDIVHRLESEHVIGRRLATAYADASRAYRPGDLASGARLATAARAYADFLRGPSTWRRRSCSRPPRRWRPRTRRSSRGSSGSRRSGSARAPTSGCTG